MVTEHRPPIICNTLVMFGKTTPTVQVTNEKSAVAMIFL